MPAGSHPTEVLEAAQRSLLARALTGHLGYVGLDRRPRVVPVWYALEDDTLLIASAAGEYKCRSLRRHPAAVLTVSTGWPYRLLSAHGEAELHPLPWAIRREFVPGLARRFLSETDSTAWLETWLSGPAADGELIRIQITRLT